MTRLLGKSLVKLQEIYLQHPQRLRDLLCQERGSEKRRKETIATLLCGNTLPACTRRRHYRAASLSSMLPSESESDASLESDSESDDDDTDRSSHLPNTRRCSETRDEGESSNSAASSDRSESDALSEHRNSDSMDIDDPEEFSGGEDDAEHHLNPLIPEEEE